MPTLTPPAPRALPRPPAWAALALCCCCCACSDALTALSPEVQQRAALTLRPEALRRGDPDALVLAWIDTPPDAPPPLIVDLDFDGDDIALTQLDTGRGAGCQLPGVAAALDDLALDPDAHFPICLFLALDPDAKLGRRHVTLALTLDGTPTLARGRITIINALPNPTPP